MLQRPNRDMESCSPKNGPPKQELQTCPTRPGQQRCNKEDSNSLQPGHLVPLETAEPPNRRTESQQAAGPRKPVLEVNRRETASLAPWGGVPKSVPRLAWLNRWASMGRKLPGCRRLHSSVQLTNWNLNVVRLDEAQPAPFGEVRCSMPNSR